MGNTKKIFITNNKNINLTMDNNFVYLLNSLNSYSNNLEIAKINSINIQKLYKIANTNRILFKDNKDILIIRWALKKKITENLRGYCLIFNLIGLGFTMTIWKNNQIRFNIGYNHLIYYNIPKGVLIRSKSRRNLFLFSNSFFLLKKISTEIKNFRQLSVYKLKGIKDKNELYNKKNWKKGLY